MWRSSDLIEKTMENTFKKKDEAKIFRKNANTLFHVL